MLKLQYRKCPWISCSFFSQEFCRNFKEKLNNEAELTLEQTIFMISTIYTDSENVFGIVKVFKVG